MHVVVPDEASALGVISAVGGALGFLALVALFRAIDPSWPGRWATAAALLAVASPLYWMTAARPLSDSAGLAASIAIQAFALPAATRRRVIAASFLAALAMGIRSQVAWLTVPVVLYAIVRQRPQERARVAVMALAAFAAGAALWALPLVLLTGGPAAYWHALFNQGAEDLTGIQMLWTRPTPRQLRSALYYAFVAPWAFWQMAAAVLTAAVLYVGSGFSRTSRARHVLLTIALAFGPYFAFDLLFQETITTRYALPLIPPVAYLAVRGIALLSDRLGHTLVVGAALVNAVVAAFAVQSYASTPAPAFRMIDDMRAAAAPGRGARVLAMHRREDLDLRRPIEWIGAAMPPFSRRLPAPPKHEWLELVKYWNGGGRDTVWFVADPQRTDLALVDRSTVRTRAYTWPLQQTELIGGVRPGEMHWHVIDAPGWYLGEGWSLTPETAGVAFEDVRGPGLDPIEGWIRRRPDSTTLMIGGRNFSNVGPPARLVIAIDGRQIETMDVPPGFFLRLLALPADALGRGGDYARLVVSADQPGIAVEQFDAQPAGRIVFGFGEGWHEKEYSPATGRTWRWMTERGVVRARGASRALRLTLRGETETFSRPSRVVVRAGDRVLAQWTVDRTFSVQAQIPAGTLLDGENTIVIETDQFFVPAERSRRSQDRRHLALRVEDVELTPVS